MIKGPDGLRVVGDNGGEIQRLTSDASLIGSGKTGIVRDIRVHWDARETRIVRVQG